MVLGFFDVAVKWGNVLFFAFHAMGFGVGFFWRYVGKCEWALRGMGLGSFFRFSYLILVLLYFLCLFRLFINFDIGALIVSILMALAFPCSGFGAFP